MLEVGGTAETLVLNHSQRADWKRAESVFRTLASGFRSSSQDFNDMFILGLCGFAGPCCGLGTVSNLDFVLSYYLGTVY